MTSQIRDPQPRLRQTLAISTRGRKNAVRKSTVCDKALLALFGVSRSVPVLKFEERPGKYNVVQKIEEERKMRELLKAVS